MPPVDPTVRLTPWWVRFAVRIAELVEKGLLEDLHEKDLLLFKEAIHKINSYLPK
jgi:hypothetical protein